MNDAVVDNIDSAEEASDSETERYEKAFRETRRVLDESIETLAILEELEESIDLRDQIRLERRKLEADRSDLVRANIAFHARRATMRPPPPTLVAEIVAISKEAVELTVERATAAAAIRLATNALEKFAKIQDIQTADS
jgi:predicted  nucleic acid-binding Zn-ribbon protein